LKFFKPEQLNEPQTDNLTPGPARAQNKFQKWTIFITLWL